MMSPTNIAPTVSVLMSCYNAERWLSEAINSVLNQTFRDFEFIIVDDGSVDKTLTLIHEYAAVDDRIVVIKKPNSGLSDSLNVGIERARGIWIARLDADDICEPTRLERQIELARSNPALVFIGTGLTIIDEDGKKLKTHSYPASHAALVQSLGGIRKFPPHSSAFYRATTVKAIGGYRGKLSRAEDWDLWLRLSELGQLACLQAPLLQIRKHTAQISNSEGGRRQLIDARLATIAYWLRQFRFPDPVAADQASVEAFGSWVQMQLEKKSVFAFQEHMGHMRSDFAMSRFPLNIIRLISACVASPVFTVRFANERMRGESLPRRLALEWIAKTSAGNT